MKLVYTVLTDGYDLLKPPIIPPAEDTFMLAFILYEGPKDRVVSKYQGDNLRWNLFFYPLDEREKRDIQQRQFKFDPWTVGQIAGVEWEKAWYVDASYLIQGASSSGNHKSPGEMIDLVDDGAGVRWDLVLSEHPTRKDVFEEFSLCIELGKIRPEHAAQFLKYTESMETSPSGLFEMGSFMVANTDKARLFMKELVLRCEQVSSFMPVRDQLLTPYVFSMMTSKEDGPLAVILNHESMHLMLESNGHTNEPWLPNVKFSIPFSNNKDLGSAYNEFYSSLSDDEWGVVMDMDCLFTDSRAGRFIAQACSDAGFDDFEILVPLTNHVNNRHQCAGRVINDKNDLDYHSVIERTMRESFGSEIEEWDFSKGFPAGMFICMKKSTWEKVKFIRGLKGVDWDFFNRVQSLGIKVGLMKGVYCYHWHRGKIGEPWTHLY